MVGMATSFVRDKTWCLATYAVRPDQQSRGIGKQLLAAALHHGRGCLRGMLSASSDPSAVRRYRQAGFSLHPQMFLTGTARPGRHPGRREGARGERGRHRPDGLGRPPGPRGGAWSRSPAHAGSCGAASSPTPRPAPATPTSTRTAGGPAGRHQPAYCDPPAVDGFRRRRGGADRSATSRAANEWAIDVGHRRAAGAPHPWLPRAARDEAAGAVRSQRCPALAVRRRIGSEHDHRRPTPAPTRPGS